ncbi:MAG: MFS transporter [Sulfolobales archaeon]
MLTYTLIFINSVIVSAVNLAVSLKTFEVTNSVFYVSLTVLIYNISYILMSWTWTKTVPNSDAPRKLLFAVFLGYLVSALAIGLSNMVYLILICSCLIGFSSAISSPLLISILGNQIGKDHLTVSRYNLISSIASVTGYLIGWLSDNTTLVLITSSAVSVPAILVVRYLKVVTLIEFKKELHIPTIPNVTGRVKGTPTIAHSHTLLYEFRTLFDDLFRTLRKGIVRELQLLLVGTVTLFTAISTFFTPFPAYLKSNKLSDGDVFIMNLLSSTTSIVGFRVASKFVKSVHTSWSVLRLCIGLRLIIFSIPLLSFSLIQNLYIIKVSLGIFYILIGFTWAFISSSLTNLILSLSEPHKKGERFGHMNGAIGIGSILGSLISTSIGIYGALISYLFVAVFLLISLAVLNKAPKTLVT